MNIIESFYSCFQRLDGDGMAACYHPDIEFRDPAFGTLHGDRAKFMWKMLCDSQKGKSFVVTFSNISLKENRGSADWSADYIFSKTGRKVVNHISASFLLKDGLIYKHDDRFNLHKWSSQAFGITGFFIGWTPFFRKKLQRQTNRLLDKYIEKQQSIPAS